MVKTVTTRIHLAMPKAARRAQAVPVKLVIVLQVVRVRSVKAVMPAAAGGGGAGWYGGGGSGNCGGVADDGGGAGGSSYMSNTLSSTKTIAGSASMPAPQGGNETGHAGNGYARITLLK